MLFCNFAISRLTTYCTFFFFLQSRESFPFSLFPAFKRFMVVDGTLLLDLYLLMQKFQFYLVINICILPICSFISCFFPTLLLKYPTIVNLLSMLLPIQAFYLHIFCCPLIFISLIWSHYCFTKLFFNFNFYKSLIYSCPVCCVSFCFSFLIIHSTPSFSRPYYILGDVRYLYLLLFLCFELTNSQNVYNICLLKYFSAG